MFDSSTSSAGAAACFAGVDDDPWLVDRLPDDRPDRVVGDPDDWWETWEIGVVPAPRLPGLALGAWLEDSRSAAGFPAPEVDAESDAVRDTERQAGDRVIGWRRMRGWTQAHEMREIAAMADRAIGRAEATGSVVLDAEAAMVSLCAELALLWRVAPRTATARVAEAVNLVQGVPLSVQFLAEGRVDMAHVHAIADIACVLGREQGARVEADVLGDAECDGATPAALRQAARRAAIRLDPDSAEKLHREKRRQRAVTLTPEDDGMASVAAYLPAEQARILYGTVDEHARRIPAEDPTGGSSSRSMDARRADALVDLVVLGALAATDSLSTTATADVDDSSELELESESGRERAEDSVDSGQGADTETETETETEGEAEGARGRRRARRQGCRECGHGRVRSRRRPRTEVRVVVSADTLLGLDELPAELVGHGPITAHHARRLAASESATWRRVLTDPESGTVLDVGTTRYRPPAGMAEHVKTRDPVCGFPGCGVPAWACDLDHVVPFDPVHDTGPTAATNLTPECERHHQVKHLPGWHVRRLDDGALVWTTPTGRRHVTRRPPLLGRVV